MAAEQKYCADHVNGQPVSFALIVQLLAELVRARPETLHDIIGRAVAELGQIAEANRCYVFEIQPNGMLSNTHEWVAPGVMPVIDDLQDMQPSLLEGCMSAFKNVGHLHLPDVANWPIGSDLRTILLEQGIKAILLVPFWDDNDLIGFIGFDNTVVAEPFDITVVSLLSSAADVIGTTLQRMRIQAEREQARKDLDRSNERLARVIDAVPDMIFELDRDGLYTGLAIGSREKMLVSMTERTGRYYGDILPAEVTKVVDRGVAAARRGEVSQAERYRLVHRGQKMWHEMTVVPVGSPGAADFRTVIIVRDVTEKEQARRDVERTALVAELMTNLVIMSDADGNVLWANAAFEKKSGYSLADMEGRSLLEFTRASATDPKTQAEIADAMAARRPFSGQLLNATKSGEEYWVELNIAFQRSEGTDEGIFVSVATDITHQKRSEEVLASYVVEEQRASELLRRAAQHTQTILDNVDDAIVTVGLNGAIISVNNAAERIFGHPSSQLKGRNIAILFRREDGFKVASGLKDNAIEAHDLTGRTHYFDAVRKNGTMFPIELSVAKIEASEAGHSFFIVVARDITERKRVEQMQSEFLATVSHELRTPLTSIQGTLSLLQGGLLGVINDQGQDLINTARRNANVLEGLVSDMLDLERLSQGKLDIKCSEECLPTLIRDTVNLHMSYASQYKVEVLIEEPLPRTKVSVDASRAIQVLTNFLSNAVKHSEAGGTVFVGAAMRDGYARVSVVDAGPGIPKDKQGLLFKKFGMIDTSDSRNTRGTGLGLAISRELAEGMDGNVGLISEEGKGSEFWVDFRIPEKLETLKFGCKRGDPATKSVSAPR